MKILQNKDSEIDSPIVMVLASAAAARTRANYSSQLKRLLCGHWRKNEISGKTNVNACTDPNIFDLIPPRFSSELELANIGRN